MSIPELILTLTKNKIYLTADSGKLKIEAPVGVVDDEIKELLRSNKQEIIEYLSQYDLSRKEMSITKVDRSKLSSIPLSFSQNRLWFIDQFEKNAAYNIPVALRLNGELDKTALKLALQRIVDRHEILRTIFVQDSGGDPIQHIKEDVCINVTERKIQGKSHEDREQDLKSLVMAESSRGFDLSSDLMLRATLVEYDDLEHVLIVVLHHVAADGWSLGVLVKEFSQLYDAFSEGAADPLPDLELQYCDYACWQRGWLKDSVLNDQLSYWQKKLDGIPEVHSLPLDYPRPLTQDFNGAEHRSKLPLELTRSLNELCQSQGATLFMGLNALFSMLLARYSGERDIVIGTPVANREQPGLEPLIGCFINTIILRNDLSNNPDFKSLLAQSRSNAFDAYAHQQVPFEKLVEKLQGTRSLSYAPLFQIMLVLQNNDLDELKLHKLAISPVNRERKIAKYDYDLTLNVHENEQGLILDWEYSSDLFEQRTIERMAGHFTKLVEKVIEDPNQRVLDVPILSANEFQKVIYDWNSFYVENKKDICIHNVIEEQVKETPYSTALVYGNDSLTYIELNNRANKIAHYLRSCEIGPGALVGICLGRSIDMVVSMLGVLKAGGAYVPLDPSYPVARLSYMLKDACVSRLITTKQLSNILPQGIDERVICLDDDGFSSELNCHKDSNPVRGPLTPDDLAYVIYTSGSTGKPKGVMIEHRNVVNLFGGLDAAVGGATDQAEQEVWLATTSISFDISVLELFWSLSNGSKVIIQPDRVVNTGASNTDSKEATEFSLFYFASDDSRENQDKYELLLKGAKFADEHGFSAVWVPERHFHSFGGQYPSPAVAASAVAAITENVQVRSGSIVLPLHDPVSVAEEWSMIDNMSNGRVGVSFASGWHPNDFVFSPENFDDRHNILKRRIEEFKNIWAGGEYKRINGIGKQVDVSIRPIPKQSMPMIWVTAAGSPDTFRYAGSIGANVLTHLLGQTLEDLTSNIEIYRDSLAKHGYDRNSGNVTLMLHTFVANDSEFVSEVVWQPFRNYLKDSIGLMKPIADEAGLDIKDDEETIIDMAYQRFFHSAGLFGTPESCLYKINEISKCGVNEVGCLIDFGIPPEITIEHMECINELKGLVRQDHNQRKYFSEKESDGSDTVSLLAKHNVTHVQLTPSHMKQLLSNPEGAKGIAALDKILIGGEAWPAGLASKLNSLTKSDIFNMYGPTETTVWSSVSQVIDGAVRVGRGFLNTNLYILDENMNPTPIGVPGELYIGGDGVGRGYYKRESLTAERFVDNPFAKNSNSKLYRTGDLMRWLDIGALEYIGRIDEQVKVRGFRVELGEIESVLSEHAQIDEVVVTVSHDDNGSQLVAYCVFKETQNASSIEALRKFLSSSLPDYMVPTHFVPLEALPLTPNGKIDKKSLPHPGDGLFKREYVAPENETQRELCQIWENVLDVDRVGINDNFFLLGGNSLLATKVVYLLTEKFGIEYSLKLFFSQQEIRQAAEHIDKQLVVKNNKELDSVTENEVVMEW